jgi:hypothetical protein
MGVDKLNDAHRAIGTALRGRAPVANLTINKLVADFFSKLRECEEEGEIDDDTFLNGLADVEHYLWTGEWQG